MTKAIYAEAGNNRPLMSLKGNISALEAFDGIRPRRRCRPLKKLPPANLRAHPTVVEMRRGRRFRRNSRPGPGQEMSPLSRE